MATFYWITDTSQFVLMPQMTVLRSRFKGVRESWKVNLEINQFAYDIYQLYYRTNNDQNTFESQTYNVEFGTDFYDGSGNPVQFTIEDNVVGYGNGAFGAQAYDATPSSSTAPAAIIGTQDVISRIQRLRWRIQLLESKGW